MERGDKGAWKRSRQRRPVDRRVGPPRGAATLRGVCFNAVVLFLDLVSVAMLFSTSTEIDSVPTCCRQCYRAQIFRGFRSISRSIRGIFLRRTRDSTLLRDRYCRIR